ncbi:MAG TPA: hypothetical protein VGM99_02515 [Candidatus Cybelea sp.]|jgi:hypothetical protein
MILDRGEMKRSRWTSVDRVVDCTSASFDCYAREIANGHHHYLIGQLASGHGIDGDEVLASQLRSIARERLSTRPPSVSRAALLGLMSAPYDLLSEFKTAAEDDFASAAVVVASLLRATTDCFFATNRLWAVPSSEVVPAIQKHDPAAAVALRRVVGSSVSQLSRDPEPLVLMVALLCRDPMNAKNASAIDDDWGAPRPGVSSEPPIDGRISHALRAYRRDLQSEQIVEKELVTA